MTRAKKKIKYLLLLAMLSGLFVYQPVQADSALTVSGNQILWNGTPIILRGVAVGDPHSRVTIDKRDSQADYRTIKNDWQANVVRLSVHPGVFIDDWSNGQRILEQEVAAARSQGLFVIIDWHVIGVPNGWYKDTSPDNKYYTYNSDFSTAEDFWRYAAKKYQTDNGVLFELWNEPVNESNDLAWQDLRPYLAKLVGLIRSNGSQNVIIAPGVWWDYDLSDIKDSPLNSANIAYSWHIYSQFDSHMSWDSALNNLNQTAPVIITEWGSEDSKDFGSSGDTYNYLEAMKNFIIDKNLSYTAWCWHNSWKPRLLNNNWQEPTAYGLLVKDFLINPQKVKDRLSAAKQQEAAAAEAARQRAAELQAAEQKAAEQIAAQQKTAVVISNKPDNKQSEFALRVAAYLKNGADANSTKLGRGERQSVLSNFIAVYGQQPANENQWQDLILISNGHWPARISQAAEDKAKKNFVKIYGRQPNLRNNVDKHAIKIMAYGIRPRANMRNLNKEKVAIGNFKKIFKRLPASDEDWNMVRSVAYGGVRR